MFDPASVRFRGPLTAHVGGFWAKLRDEGYAPLSGRNLLLVAAHFSRWLDGRRLELGDLSEECVGAFLEHRRRQGYTQFLSPRALGPLLGYLRGVGVVVRPAVVVETPTDRLLREYAEYLARERCLSAGTIRSRTDIARQFATVRFDTESPRWDQLTPSDIADFVRHESRRWSIGYCKSKVTGLRSLLRFLLVRGDIQSNLAEISRTACRRWPGGGWRGCRRPSSQLRSRASSSRPTGGRSWACAMPPSFVSWSGSVCEPERWPHSRSMISTGGRARSSSMARARERAGCRSPRTSARSLPHTCSADGPAHLVERSSCAAGRRIGDWSHAASSGPQGTLCDVRASLA